MLKEKTRILVTHAIDFLHLADQVVIMHDGKINASGSFESLKENEILKELLEINKINQEEQEKNKALEKKKKQRLL